MQKIKVLVVDDSAVVRQVLQQALATDPAIQVLGAAPDPIFALERMRKEWPDVVILDVEMPRMDGLTFLRKLMAEHPTPVVICSSLTQKGAETTVQALAAGAVEIFTKPTNGLKEFLQGAAKDLIAAVKTAAVARVRAKPQVAEAAQGHLPPKLSADAILPAAISANHAMAETTDRFVAIGTSTGGTQALEVILPALKRTAPGIVIVQHMPEKFTATFAERLDSLCEIEVREAKGGERVIPGRALIAPGGKHMLVKRSGAQYHVEVVSGPPVSRHCPSVDVLFRSVAKCAGRNATGIIMTGMGDDGARGLKEMRDAGSPTWAQDEESCVVFGMPKEAIKLGGVGEIVSLTKIPAVIMASANPFQKAGFEPARPQGLGSGR